jgi:hypothetical protein
VDGGDAAGMAGAPGFEQVERLGAAHLADDDAVGAQAQAWRAPARSSRRHRPVRSGTWSARRHCSSTVSSASARRSPSRRLRPARRWPASSCRCWCRRRPGCSALRHRARRNSACVLGHDAVGHIVGERDHGDTRALADCEHRRGRRPAAACPRSVRRFPAAQRRAAGAPRGPRRQHDAATSRMIRSPSAGPRSCRSASRPVPSADRPTAEPSGFSITSTTSGIFRAAAISGPIAVRSMRMRRSERIGVHGGDGSGQVAHVATLLRGSLS